VAPEGVISIVEDDESLRVALVGFVRSLGYSARGFPTAEEYLSVRDGRCTCVITDLQLPGMSGLDMIPRLREMGYTVPVIVVTARTEAALEQEAYAGGAFCFVRKPFEMPVLLDCLERALAA